MPRKRIVEPWEAELRDKARELRAERDIEILRTAALMLVGRRLDEIAKIIHSAGFSGRPQESAPAVLGVDTRAVAASPDVHPCQECGREAVIKTKPNKFNRTGSWLCRTHIVYRSRYETGTEIKPPEPPPPPPPKPDTGGDVTMSDAFANAETVN